MKKKFIFFIFLLIFIPSLFSQYSKEIFIPFLKWWEPEGLSVFKEAYPDFEFVSSFDRKKNDWLVHIFKIGEDGKKTEKGSLYWAESRFLPEEKLSVKFDYRKMLYDYPSKPLNPEDFSLEEIERIKIFTSKENRKNSAIDPPFLFNIIFDCENRSSVESHIVNVPFLTKSVNVHEAISKKIETISKKILSLPRDEKMTSFLKTLSRTDGYAWRTVRDTQSRSFHSIGLAVDVLPKGYYQKTIYWAWQKQLDPENWFLTPLEKRWMPPKEVIEIFESEGFIWGGFWLVWDNMHFEYHPELLIYRDKKIK